MTEVAKPTPAKTSFQDKEKPTEVRLSNILAAKGKCHNRQLFWRASLPCRTHTHTHTTRSWHSLIAVGDAIRTSLGPRGMDKMVRSTQLDNAKITSWCHVKPFLDSNQQWWSSHHQRRCHYLEAYGCSSPCRKDGKTNIFFLLIHIGS